MRGHRGDINEIRKRVSAFCATVDEDLRNGLDLRSIMQRLLRTGISDRSMIPNFDDQDCDLSIHFRLTEQLAAVYPFLALAYRNHCFATTLLHRAEPTLAERLFASSETAPFLSLALRGFAVRSDLGRASLFIDREGDGREYLRGTDDTCQAPGVADGWLVLARLPRTAEERELDESLEILLSPEPSEIATIVPQHNDAIPPAAPRGLFQIMDLKARSVAFVFLPASTPEIDFGRSPGTGERDGTLAAYHVPLLDEHVLARGDNLIKTFTGVQVLWNVLTNAAAIGSLTRQLADLDKRAHSTPKGDTRMLVTLAQVRAQLNHVKAVYFSQSLWAFMAEEESEAREQLALAEITDRLNAVAARLR